MRIRSSRIALGVTLIAAILIFPWVCPSTQAQASTSFSQGAKFSIPGSNGSISFAVNGSYATATLQNNTWVFTNLHLARSQPLQNLQISTTNANVTVESYVLSSFNTPSERLNILVQGKGRQVVNMGVSAQAGAGSVVNWIVSSNGTFISNGWKISRNGTITVTGLTGNLSIIFFGFTSQLGNRNEPFYDQHSVAIAVAAALAVTVTAAVAVKVRANKHLKGDNRGEISVPPASSKAETWQETWA